MGAVVHYGKLLLCYLIFEEDGRVYRVVVARNVLVVCRVEVVDPSLSEIVVGSVVENSFFHL